MNDKTASTSTTATETTSEARLELNVKRVRTHVRGGAPGGGTLSGYIGGGGVSMGASQTLSGFTNGGVF